MTVPWIRVLDMPDHDVLSRVDVDVLREAGFNELADIAEKYVVRRERRWRNRLRRRLAAVLRPPTPEGGAGE